MDGSAYEPEDSVAGFTLAASRALLGVVARSVMEALEDVTLPQFRVLVVLTAHGRLPIGAVQHVWMCIPPR